MLKFAKNNNKTKLKIFSHQTNTKNDSKKKAPTY